MNLLKLLFYLIYSRMTLVGIIDMHCSSFYYAFRNFLCHSSSNILKDCMYSVESFKSSKVHIRCSNSQLLPEGLPLGAW